MYIGKAPQLQGAYEKADNISSQFNSADTVFAVQVGSSNKTIAKATNLIVAYDVGAVQADRILLEPDVDYTISGYEITFTSTPSTGDYCWIMILGDVGAV